MKFVLMKYFYPLILTLITILICFQNYSPGTYVSGWDTLHPEFNFADYFKRTLSVWQQHQGLGAAASQAHAAELPRLILYYLTSLVIPASFLRYSYFFLCLLLGPLGMYFFIKEFSGKKLIAYLSGLLYLLNLVTLQHFFVPLEMFATHYASLPWLFLFSTKYLARHNRKDLILFSLTVIFSSSSAHTPTLYYAFFVCFMFYLILACKFLSKNLKRPLILAALVLLLNSYWILPNVYYVFNYGASVTNSKINYQFSERAYQTGNNYGNLLDTALLKNFLFDWGEYDSDQGKFVFLLKTWKNHLNNPIFPVTGLLLFVAVVGGIFISIKQKSKLGLIFLPLFVLPFVFINNDNFIFQWVIGLLDETSSILKESLRFPFTKFSIMLLFAYCVYFSIFLNYLIPKTSGFFKKYNHLFWGALISVLLLAYMFPMFTGNLIGPGMRVKIPKEYFELFNWFKTQNPNTRIATFPINTFWGWSYYNFGYEGAGFLWFGLNQPVLEREFDRWHPANEDYYHQMSYSVYAKDLNSFENTLEKYQVNWLLVDKNIIDVSSPKAVFVNQLEELITGSSKITREKEFNNLVIYRVNLNVIPNNFISLIPELKTVGPVYNKTNYDQGFKDSGYYKESNQPEIYYPFRSLLSNINPREEEFTVNEFEDKFIFRKKIPDDVNKLKFNIPAEKSIVWFDQNNLEKTGIYQPTVMFNGEEITVTVPKIKNYFSSEIDPSKKISLSKLKDCDYLLAKNQSNLKRIKDELVEVNDKSVLRLNSVLSNNCSAEFLLPTMSHEFGYLITVESRNVQNKTILFWLENLTSKKADIETYLPKTQDFEKLFFIQPPMEQYGQGYFMHFDNVSFNKKATVNDLGEISIYPIPFNFLTEINFGNTKTKNDLGLNNCLSDVKHNIGFYYSLKINNDCNDKADLILSQSNDQGWVAFDTTRGLELLGGKKLVNNWENGWDINLEKTKSIIIFFIPQLLQFLGYGLFIFGLIVLLIL